MAQDVRAWCPNLVSKSGVVSILGVQDSRVQIDTIECDRPLERQSHPAKNVEVLARFVHIPFALKYLKGGSEKFSL